MDKLLKQFDLQEISLKPSLVVSLADAQKKDKKEAKNRKEINENEPKFPTPRYKLPKLSPRRNDSNRKFDRNGRVGHGATRFNGNPRFQTKYY